MKHQTTIQTYRSNFEVFYCDNNRTGFDSLTFDEFRNEEDKPMFECEARYILAEDYGYDKDSVDEIITHMHIYEWIESDPK